MEIVSRCNHCGENIFGHRMYSHPCENCRADGHDQIVPCSRCLFLFEEDERQKNPLDIRIKISNPDPPLKAA